MFPPITFIWSVGSVVTGRCFSALLIALFKAYTHFKSSAAVKRSGKTIGFIGFVQRRPVTARAFKVVTQRSGAVMKNWRIPKANQALNLTQNHLLLYEVQSCESSTSVSPESFHGFGPVSLALTFPVRQCSFVFSKLWKFFGDISAFDKFLMFPPIMNTLKRWVG